MLTLLRNLFRPRQTGRIRATAHPPAASRRDLGWHWAFVTIGIALAIGSYFWYVSARILQEPVRLEFGPGDPAFPAALGPLLGAEFTTGNTTKILVNGAAFFPPMLQAIRAAKKSVTLETYIWAPGKISGDFIAALADRARHGVKVHVLLDGMGTLKFREHDRAQMTSAGVRVVTYGRQHWYEIKPNINHRTHRKILVVDGAIGFTGGMCIDDHWLGNADSPETWRETQVRAEGPVVHEMQAVFASNWLQTTGELLLGEAYFPQYERRGQIVAQCFMSGPAEGAQSARVSYLFAIASARKTIDIEHAYFVPDDLATAMLLEARRRGVRIRVIIPAINDSRFGRAASRSRWGPLLASGVEFYQYQPAMLHAKTMSVDDTFVTIGSVNFDNRSFSINDEVALNVLDSGFGRDHLKMFEFDLGRSVRLTQPAFEGRAFYIKWLDHFCGLFRSQL